MKPPIKGMKTKPISHEVMAGAWEYVCDENPFWKDKYITRGTQKKLRKRYLGEE